MQTQARFGAIVPRGLTACSSRLAPFDHEPAHQVEPFVTVPPELMPFMA